MTREERRRRRQRTRAGYGEQPQIKIIAYAITLGIRRRLRKIFKKSK